MPLRRANLFGILREPLVHFLLIGGAIFGLYSFTADPQAPGSDSRIVITSGEIENLRSVLENRLQYPPTAQELGDLIDERIREEVLYREAVALGLDRDDAVFRRLLRLKFEFVTQNLAVAIEPDAVVLAAWFEDNRDRYRAPVRLSFTQIYFNLDRRGAAGEREARLVLASLRADAGDAVTAAVGDGQLLLDGAYRDLPVPEVQALFGPEFAEAVSRLDPGAWSGPIASGYGLHLVRLDGRRDGEAPALAEIEQKVLADWTFEQRLQANEAIYRQLLSRYEVIVESTTPAATGAGAEGNAL